MKKFFLVLLTIFVVYLLNAQPEIKVQLGHSNGVNSVIFSPDGKYVLSGSIDKTIKLWDVNTGREIKTFVGHTDDVKSVIFFQNGEYFISSSGDYKDGTIRIWRTKDSKLLKTIKCRDEDGENEYIKELALSSDGKYIMYATFHFIKILDASSYRLIKSIKFDCFSGSSCFSSNGKYALYGGEDGILKLVDVSTGETIKTFVGHTGKVEKISFSPDGNTALSYAEDKKLILWDIASGKIVKKFDKEYDGLSKIFSIAFSPNGKYAATSTYGHIKIWDINSGSLIGKLVGHRSDWGVVSVAFSPDGNKLVSGSADQSIKIWDLNTGKDIKTIKGPERVFEVAFSPDGRSALSCSWDKTIKLWDLATGKVVRNFTGHTNYVYSVVFSPDGRYALSGSLDETMRIWNVNSGEEVKQINLNSGAVHSVAFSPDGRYALAGCYKSLKLFDVNTGEEIRTYSGQKDIKSVAFSPDGKYFLSGSSDGTLKYWNLNSSIALKTVKGHSSYIESVAISQNGKYALSGSMDETIKLWDINTGQEIKTYYGTKGDVQSVAFSPDGRHILSGGDDNIVKLWDINTGKIVKNYIGHSNMIFSVAYSPDGKNILSSSMDGTVRYWDANTGELLSSSLSTPEGEYLSWIPEGYFAGSEKLAKDMVYILDGKNITSIDQLFETFYRPDIVSAKAKGEDISKYNLVTIQQGLSLPPLVKIANPQPYATLTSEQVEVSVEVTDQGGGVDEIRLYQNGKLLDGTQRGFKNVSSKNNAITKTFTVSLVDGQNQIKATAFNNQRIEAIPNEILVQYNSVQQAKPNMYILAIGINSYQNPRYSLNYALNDANGFVVSIEKCASGIFDKVDKTVVNDAQATREGIMAAIDNIKAKSKPQDVFIFYYAGHGVMSTGNEVEKSEFFLVPYDITKMYEADDLLKSRGISAKEMVEFSKTIKAQKQLFVLDACQSGGAMQTFATRGAAEEKAIAQLARSTGTYFIAASGTEQFASEVTTLGHGIFTYSIIKSLGGECKSQGNKITVSLLKSCVEDMVPALTQKYKNEVQYPTGYGFGQDFPIGIINN